MESKHHRSDERWLGPARFASIATGCLGAILTSLGLAMVWTTGWGKDLFAPGAALITVGLTAYVANKSLVTWSEQRLRDREAASQKRREVVYEGLVQQMTSFMVLGMNPLRQTNPKKYAEVVHESERRDGELRSSMMTWADEETLAGLAHWRQTLSDRVVQQATQPREQWTNLESVFGDTVLLLRKSLLGDKEGWSIDKEILLAAMFDGRRLPTTAIVGHEQ